MTLEEYERVLDEAFCFLVSDFHYSSRPAQSGGGRFGAVLTKVFARGPQTITLLIGDVDAKEFCAVIFSDGDEEQLEFPRRHFRQRTLGLLLQRKGVDHSFPDSHDLRSDAARRDALAACGRIVREHAIDVVDGDFSAFPQLVYVVQHVDRRYPTGEVRRTIGPYSSFGAATKAISKLMTLPGFVIRQDGFEVDCFELDAQWMWASGIPIQPSKQATEFYIRAAKATSFAEFDSDEQREIEARWLAKFSSFQYQVEVSLAGAHPSDHPEQQAALARYPREHWAWASVLGPSDLRRSRSAFVDELRNSPLALDCWNKARESGNLSSRFVAFIDEAMRDLK